MLLNFLNSFVRDDPNNGSLSDSFEFLFNNTVESTKLWIRLQFQGPVKDRAKREKERHDLRVLVGANLVRMSQLEGMTPQYYSSSVLPRLIEHIVNSRDILSQHYLLDCIVQGQPVVRWKVVEETTGS